MSQQRSSPPAPIPLRTVDAPRGPVETGGPSAPETWPRPLTSLIGRDADVTAALALLVDAGVRLLTLTGPGGVGKTRLALRIGEQAATAFPDGVGFVPLAAIGDPDLVLPTIARRLGLREDTARSAAALLADALRGQHLLLVLDNFEQVRPAATQLAALLAACPDVVALVTSRVPLRVAGEQRFPVAPLALPALASAGAERPDDLALATIAAAEAVQLFVVRARAADPRFSLGAENAVAIAGICRRLDGLPLAIELAAARTHVFPPAVLLAHLGATLPFLTGGPEDAPDRLRTMRDAIAWSYDLLSPEEQALFRRLASFVGGFTLEAAEEVVGGGPGAPWAAVAGNASRTASPVASTPPATRRPPPATLDLVASLVDTSLLQRIEAGGKPRFTMLETIREFGVEQLAASGEAESIAARHAAWCVSLAEGIRRAGGLSHRRGLATLEAEHPNLRTALAWLLDHGETATALHLAAQLAEFWMRHSHYMSEGEAWLERALAADDGEPTAARAEALVGLNMMLWARNAHEDAQELLREAEAVARTADNAGTLAYARLHQGYVALYQDQLELAVARGEEALTVCEAIPQGFSCHGALWLLARTALARGEDDRATELYERLLDSAHAGDDEISVANSHYGLAILAERRGELGPALAGFVEAAAVCRGFGDRLFASHSLNEAAAEAVALGRPEPAVRLYAAAASVRTAIGAMPEQMAPHNHERALAAARAALGENRFATAWEAGLALSLDAAIAEAAALAQNVTQPESVHPRVGPAGLTAREHDVLRLLVGGLTDKEIAVALGIGRRTVSNHVATIRGKLDAPSRTAAATIAVRDGLV